MTPESAALQEAIYASEQLASHLERLIGRLRDRFPVDHALATWSDEERERLHAFFHMFKQLYDLMARRLLRGILFVAAEDHKALSYRAIVRRAERLVGVDGNAWLAIGETRNKLVHEYATSALVLADQANAAWRATPGLLRAHREILAHLQAEGEFQ